MRQDKKAATMSFKINSFESEKPETFSASGIDAALEMLQVVESGPKATAQDRLDRHPERRVKSAFLAFQDVQMPLLKVRPFAARDLEAV